MYSKDYNFYCLKKRKVYHNENDYGCRYPLEFKVLSLNQIKFLTSPKMFNLFSMSQKMLLLTLRSIKKRQGSKRGRKNALFE